MLLKVEKIKTVWVGMSEDQVKTLRLAISKVLDSAEKLDERLKPDEREALTDLRTATIDV